jgi:hypothetical protein
VNSNIRSALIGGLAATFVVAASLAPKVLHSDNPSDVRFHQTTAAEEITSSTEGATTPTTEAPTTTTTAEVAQRVTHLEQRVTVIEQSTTTTTPPPAVPPTVSLQNGISIVDGVPTVLVLFFNHQDVQSRACYPDPAVRIGITIDGVEQEIVAPIPPLEEGRFNVAVPGATADNITAHVLDTEWTGGSLPLGAGHPWSDSSPRPGNCAI